MPFTNGKARLQSRELPNASRSQPSFQESHPPLSVAIGGQPAAYYLPFKLLFLYLVQPIYARSLETELRWGFALATCSLRFAVDVMEYFREIACRGKASKGTSSNSLVKFMQCRFIQAPRPRILNGYFSLDNECGYERPFIKGFCDQVAACICDAMRCHFVQWDGIFWCLAYPFSQVEICCDEGCIVTIQPPSRRCYRLARLLSVH